MNDDRLWWAHTLLAVTLCRLGRHSRPANQIRKYDGGRRSLLCRHCYKIVGNWRNQL